MSDNATLRNTVMWWDKGLGEPRTDGPTGRVIAMFEHCNLRVTVETLGSIEGSIGCPICGTRRLGSETRWVTSEAALREAFDDAT